MRKDFSVILIDRPHFRIHQSLSFLDTWLFLLLDFDSFVSDLLVIKLSLDCFSDIGKSWFDKAMLISTKSFRLR